MESNIQIAITIKNETKIEANTATRVGALLESICKDLQTLFNTPVGITMNPVDDYIGIEKIAPSISLFNCVTQPVAFDGVVFGIQPKEAGVVNYTGVYYASDLKIFVAKSGNDYYTIWGAKQAYGSESLYVKNGKALFKIYYNNSDASLYVLNRYGLFKLSQGFQKVIQWSGKVIDDGKLLESGMSGSEPEKIVFVKSVNSFAYQEGSNLYSDWENRTDFQEQVKISSIQQVPSLFRNNLFKGLDGSIWAATDYNTVVCVSESNVYVMPGDITTMGNKFDTNITGPVEMLVKAIESNKIILSGGLHVYGSYMKNYNLLSLVLLNPTFTTNDFIYKEVWFYDTKFNSLSEYQKLKIIGNIVS